MHAGAAPVPASVTTGSESSGHAKRVHLHCGRCSAGCVERWHASVRLGRSMPSNPRLQPSCSARAGRVLVLPDQLVCQSSHRQLSFGICAAALNTVQSTRLLMLQGQLDMASPSVNMFTRRPCHANARGGRRSRTARRPCAARRPPCSGAVRSREVHVPPAPQHPMPATPNLERECWKHDTLLGRPGHTWYSAAGWRCSSSTRPAGAGRLFG